MSPSIWNAPTERELVMFAAGLATCDVVYHGMPWYWGLIGAGTTALTMIGVSRVIDWLSAHLTSDGTP